MVSWAAEFVLFVDESGLWEKKQNEGASDSELVATALEVQPDGKESRERQILDEGIDEAGPR